MNNFEYLITLANNGCIDDVAKMMYEKESCTEQWCLETVNTDCSNCRECFANWLKERHAEPMPDLVPGMFVKTRSIYDRPEDDDEIGVIVLHKQKGYIVVYNGYGFDEKKGIDAGEVIIKEIYNALCFNDCNESTRIWKKEN